MLADKVPGTTKDVSNDDSLNNLFANLDDIGSQQFHPNFLLPIFSFDERLDQLNDFVLGNEIRLLFVESDHFGDKEQLLSLEGGVVIEVTPGNDSDRVEYKGPPEYVVLCDLSQLAVLLVLRVNVRSYEVYGRV